MKKLSAVSLVLVLALVLGVGAMAAGTFDAGVVIEDKGDSIEVTVQDSELFVLRKTTLSVACTFQYVTVTCDGEAVEAIADGEMATFVVAKGGTYIITEAEAPAEGGEDDDEGQGGSGSGNPGSAKPETVKPVKLPFADVAKSAWYRAAVEYVYDAGLMGGTSATTFSPDDNTTRGMLMTILARMDGASTQGSPWYQAGMDWAVKTGVSDGSNPMGIINREQMVTMLWRYAGSPRVSGSLKGFADADAVSDWAGDAMVWAVELKIIEGAGGMLMPKGPASRAQMAAVLTRYCG